METEYYIDTGLSAGKHKIFYRSQDSIGRWTHDNMDTFTVSTAPPGPALMANSIAPKTAVVGDGSRLLTGTNGMDGLLISPNPAREAVDIRVSIAHTGYYALEVMDMKGRILIQKQFALNAGEQSFCLQLGDIANGSYLIVLFNGKERVFSKLIKAN